MVAIVTGTGLGLQRGSAAALGSQGQLGSATVGQGADKVTVNAANGNLVIQSQDEMLIGVGLDDVVTNTYNSQGTFTSNGWQESFQRHVAGLTGTVNTAGSTITHYTADGSAIVYTYNSSTGVYVGNELGGAYDTLSFNGSTNQWTWQDGKTRATEVYDNANNGRLIKSTDASGNALTYSYTGSQLTKITTANGDYTSFSYTGALLTSVVTSYTNASGLQTLTRVRYGYDTSNRLTTVTTDLSPSDNSVSDNNTYVVTYGYDGSSDRISSITQSDGTSLALTYTQVNSAYAVASYTQTTAAGVSQTTGFTYTTNRTTVTDPQGNATTLVYDSKGQLTQLILPPPMSGGAATTQTFTYDANGNVTYSGPVTGAQPSASMPSYSYAYDGNGNRMSMTDALGNQTTYSYNGNNQLLTRTEGANTASPQTARYVYDGNSRLVYTVSTRGDVTRHIYNSQGEQTSLIQYTGVLYTTAGTPSQSNMDAWSAAGNIDLTQTRRTDTTYDARGQIATVTTYGQVDSNGNGVGSTASTTTCIYDQAGNLLSRKLSSSSQTETFVYDGLGRMLSSTDFNGKTTSTVYSNTASGLQATVTFASGTVKTSAYDKAGDLISTTTSGVGLSATTTYAYDANGNLIRTTDPTGLTSYFVYDAQNRKVADVAADGTIIAYTYNVADQLTVTTRYANKLSPAQLSSLANETASSAPVRLAGLAPATSAGDRWSWNVYDAAGRLTETIDPVGAVTAYGYDADNRLVSTTDYAALLSASTLAGFITSAPTTSVLPAANAANDRTTRTFYNTDDQVIGTLDADGYLTQIVYDSSGVKVQTVAYANATAAADRVSGSFAQLLSDAGSSTNDIYHWWVYDGAGLLRADIDGVGNITRYDNYTVDGDAAVVTTGQVINVASLIGATPPTFAALTGLLASATGTPEITAYTYDQYGHVLTRVLTLTGGATETTTYGYDSLYNLTSQTTASSSSASGGADGRTARVQYDALGRKSAELSGQGAAALAALGSSPTQAQVNAVWASYGTTYTYDAAGRVTAQTDPLGRRTLFYYDVDGRLAYQVDPAGGVVQYGYDTFGEKSDVTAYATAIAATTLAGLTGGQITSALTGAITTSANDSHSHIDHNADGTVGDTIDALGAVTSYVYDAFGDVTSEADPLFPGGTTTTGKTYGRRGLLLSSTANVGGLGLTTSYQYDAFGRVTQVTDPAGGTTKTTYDRAGEVLTEVDALNQATTYTYDGFGHVLTQTDPTGAKITYAYSLFDRQVTATDPYGVVTTTTSNAYGQTVKVTDGTSATTTYAYDADGNLISTTDAVGNVTRSIFDAADQPAFTIDPAGAVTGYTYDLAGRVIQTVQYAALDGATGVQSLSTMQAWASANAGASDRTTQAVYDADGRLTFAVDADGYVTTYTYDNDGRVTSSMRYAAPYGGPAYAAIRSLYQATLGRQPMLGEWALFANQVLSGTTTLAQFAQTLTSSSEYQNDLAAFSDTATGNQKVVDYLYHAAFGHAPDANGPGYVTALNNGTTTAAGIALAFATCPEMQARELTLLPAQYQGQLPPVSSPPAGAQVARTTYDADGRVLTTTDATGAVTTNQYNAFGDLVAVTDPNHNTGYFYYDAMGRQILQVDAQGYATGTTYDLNGQVLSVRRYFTKVVVSGVSATPPALTTSASDNVTSFTRDNDGRVLTSTDGNNYTTSYGYDAFGDKVSMTNALGGTVTYSYDALGQMLTQTTPAGSTAPASTTAYVYDAFGNRTLMTEAQGRPEQRITTYVYDAGNRLVQQFGDAVTVTSTTGATSTARPIQTFVYDAYGNLIKATDADGAATYTYYDARDQKIGQVDALGHLTTWTYDAEGNIVSQTQYATAVTGTPPTGGTAPTVAASASDRTTLYGYDADNRQVSVSLQGVETGSWTGSAWTGATGALTTTTTYDADGNVIKTTDANGNSSYSYYDKLGRQIAQVDAGGYLTSYTLDAEGNTVSQTQYATALAGPFTAGGSPPAAPAANANDRTTTFTYDHDGQRLSETRAGATVATVSGDSAPTTTQAVTVSYTYNAMGQVTRKTEATGDATVYQYDTMGRLAAVTTASGAANAMTTLTTYDGLGNVLTTVAGSGTTYAETTSYTYGAGGRLATQTDAQGFVMTYGYDAKGQTTVQSYSRVKSDGSSVQEATLTAYTALGQVASTGKATWNGSTWVVGDLTDTYYDAFGEVVASGINTGGNAAKAQTFSDYDNAGRVWRTDSGDGVTKVYGYDGNGNQTVEVTSLGSTDLRNVASLDAALAAGGTSKTYNIYDKRGELVDVKRPIDINLDGTVASGGNVSAAPTGLISFTNAGGPYNGNTIATVNVSLLDALATTAHGTGSIHVVITASGSQVTSQTYAAGTLNCGTYTLSFPTGAQPSGSGYQPPQYPVTVTVTQDNSSGGAAFQLGSASFTAVGNPSANFTAAAPMTLGSSLQFQNLIYTASTLSMYVRPSGSTGGYTLVNVPQMRDANGNAISGAFSFDTTQPPFNATAGSSWDVKYLATDAQGHVVDAKAGTVTFGSGSPANATVANFASVAVFSAAQSNGSWVLTTNPVVVPYSDSTQAFDAFGDTVSQTDANGNMTQFTYDVLGDLYQKIAPQVTSVSESGAPSTITPTDTYYYDASGRLVGHRDADGNLTTQSLLAGSGYDGSAALTTTQYNPDGGHIATGYDIFGNVITQTDAMGAVTTNTYDRDNRLIQTADPVRGSADSAYTFGPTQRIDAYVYDGLGQRIKHINSITGPETTDYDLEGRVTRTVSFGGQVTGYSYAWNAVTASGRLTAGEAGAGAWTETTSAFGQTSSSTTDTFGKIVFSSDFGAHTTTFTYNLAGQLSHQAGSTGQSIDYSYAANGQVSGITDNATGMKSVYAYDKAGNRTVEAYYLSTGTTPVYYQNASVSYDALDRVTEFKDAKADITYSYDADGNRREVKSVYSGSAKPVTQDYWYKYDSMNRFVLTMGTMSGGVISIGTTGTAITYDARGDRMTAQNGSDGSYDTYQYSVDGYLETVKVGTSATNGTLSVVRTTDVLGRMTGYTEYQSNGTTILSTRGITYDGDNRVTTETDQTLNGATTITSQITNTYTATINGASVDEGVIASSTDVQTSGSSSSTTTTNNSYVWYAQAKSSQVSTVSGTTSGNAIYAYDVNGNLASVNDAAAARTITYQSDLFGQVLNRVETNANGSGVQVPGAQRSFFYFDGESVGDAGSDTLSSQVDYAQQLATDRAAAATAGTSVQASPATPVTYANGSMVYNSDFDTSYQAMNATSVGQAGAGYTVRDGDTLQSIALNLWGDSSLWFALAEANGLSAGANLTAGQTLSIPDNVVNLHNNSGTFKAYNPTDALGNISPTLPPEPQPPAPSHHGCGAVGDVIATIVAVVVVAVVAPYAIAAVSGLDEAGIAAGTIQAGLAADVAGGAIAGAAGGIASQAVEIAVGNQSQFNWSAVAVSAIAGGVGGGMGDVIKGASGFQLGLERGLATSVVRQGVDMAVGLQKTFSWTDVAVAGIAGGVTSSVEQWAGQNGFGKPGSLAIGGAAGALAGAATESLITGQDLGKSLRDTLPSAIGNTIGNMIGEQITSQRSASSSVTAPIDVSSKYSNLNGLNFDVANTAIAPQVDDGGFTPVPIVVPYTDEPLVQFNGPLPTLIDGSPADAVQSMGNFRQIQVNGQVTFSDDPKYDQPAGEWTGDSKDLLTLVSNTSLTQRQANFDKFSQQFDQLGPVDFSKAAYKFGDWLGRQKPGQLPSDMSSLKDEYDFMQTRLSFWIGYDGPTPAQAHGNLLSAAMTLYQGAYSAGIAGVTPPDSYDQATVGSMAFGGSEDNGIAMGRGLGGGIGSVDEPQFYAGSLGRLSRGIGGFLDNALDKVGITWGRGIQSQGDPWENFLEGQLPAGSRLPPGFKTWDFFDQQSGVAISAKTLDTSAYTYASNPKNIFSQLKGYIDASAGFTSSRLREVIVTSADIEIRQLQVAVPEYTSQAQWNQINRAVVYGQSKGVSVVVTQVRK